MTTTPITDPTHTAITDPVQTAITLPTGRIADLIIILDHSEEFLSTSGRAVRGELADYCLARPPLTSGRLIDLLGHHALRLRADLEEAGQPTPPRSQHPRPRERW